MKKHQNRFLFSRGEAEYYISQLNKVRTNQIKDDESKLLILGCLLESKTIRHYRYFKKNYYINVCRSYPIVPKINLWICSIKDKHYENTRLLSYQIQDWIRVHTIHKKANLSGPTR